MSRLYATRFPAAAVLGLLVYPAMLSATVWINNSTFGATSTGVMVFRSGGADFIDWCPTNTGSPPTGAPACGVRNDATGELLVQPGSGNFLTLAPNTPGLILDITDVSGATGPAPGASYTFFPPGVPVNINTFIRISSHPEWNFVAGLLVVPTCSGGDICVGPLKIIQTDTPNGPLTTMSMVVTGQVVDANENTSANFRSMFTAQFGLTATQVIALAQSPSGVFSNTVSSTTTITTAAAPPTIAKAFGAPTIPLGGTTTVSFTIANPNATALTGVAFTDALPAGLVIATPNGLVNTCGGVPTAVAGSGSISLTGGTVAANASCTLTVNVTSTSTGLKQNITGPISSNESGQGLTSNIATLVVLASPTIMKAFADSQIELFFGSTALTFTVSNPPANPLPLTGVGFTDLLPAGLTVLAPDNGLVGSCDGGTITALPGSNSISLAGATLGVNASCTFSVLVNGAAIGVQTNTTSPITSTNGGTGSPASASVSVVLTEFFWFFADGGGGSVH